MKVKDVMTREPLTVDPESPLGTIMDVMRDKHIRHLPVVDDDGRLIGIVTDRDPAGGGGPRQGTRDPAPARGRERGAGRHRFRS